jgi:signal transduction histidine kinase
MVLGFGSIVVATILLHNTLFVDLEETFTTLTQTVSSEVSAIDAAKRLRPFVEDEEQSTRTYLLVGTPQTARRRLEAHERVGVRLDSLERLLGTPQERILLVSFRRTHQALFTAVTYQRSMPATSTMRLADSMDVLRTRLDQIVQLNQQVISSTLADADATNASSTALWIMLVSLAVTAGGAFFIARSATRRAATKKKYRRRNGAATPAAQMKQLDKYKSEMMQQLAQELRTPLQTMHAAYYVLAEQLAGPLNDHQKQLINTIRDNVDALSSFSSQFLDLAKIEAGMVEYDRKQVDLISLLTPVINMARTSASTKNITIGLAAQYVPPVTVDPEKFSTVVGNLLNNAVKFTPNGGNITVNIGPCNSGARISVKDSGIGIDADDLPRIFTKFYQAKSASAIDAKGTGMGLALVKAIVDGHGGRVYATSKRGVGSTFTIELPRGSTQPLPHEPHPN